VRTVLEPLRTRIELDRVDAALLELEAVAADLGYGDVRALSGAVAWIDHLREHDKRIAVVDGGERGESALAIAGIADRIELTAPTYAAALAELDVTPERTVAVAASIEGVKAAVDARVYRVIAVARGLGSPEQLRRAGAHGVVAELHELL
jgi:beta-phosphoglucomutase-like phosphatase (HAD superfamily)